MASGGTMEGIVDAGLAPANDEEARPRPPRRPSTQQKLGAVLVALILLLALITILQETPEELSAPPEEVKDDAVVIAGDVTWVGEDLTLTEPIRVTAEGSLSITGCDIAIPYERFVMRELPWFKVEAGGSLTLDDSRLHVSVDRRFEGAVIAQAGPLSSTVPFLARVLNLEHAERPILSLDVAILEPPAAGPPRLFMAVKEGPDAEGRVVHEFNLTGVEHGGWTHLEAPLDEFAGTTPMVAVLATGASNGSLMVTDLRATDGGRPLAGDLGMTGDAILDKWLLDGFVDLEHYIWPYEVEFPDAAPALIDSRGDLAILDSAVSVPGRLPRMAACPAMGRVDPEAEDVGGPLMAWAATKGGHMRIADATLTLEGSTLDRVPVVAEGCVVTVSSSHLVGYQDLLTLSEPSGSVVGTTFESVERREGDDSTNWGRHIWALSVEGEGAGGPLEVRDCRFEGSEVALDLIRASVDLDGCVFEGISSLAVWSHDTDVGGGWSALNTSCSFVDCTGYLYFESHSAVFEFVGPDRPDGEEPKWAHPGTVTANGDWVMPFLEVNWADTYRAYVCMPTMVVDYDFVDPYVVARTLDSVTIKGVGPTWGGTRDVTLDTALEGGDIELPGPGAEDDYRIHFWSTYRLSDEHDTLALELNWQGEVKPGSELLFEIHMDGELVETFPVEEVATRKSDQKLEMTHDLTVPRGRHIVSLSTFMVGPVGREDVVNVMIPLYRATGSEDAAGASAMLVPNDIAYIMVDPGVVLEIEPEQTTVSNEDTYYLMLFMSNTSRVVLSGLEGPGAIWLENGAMRESALELHDIDLGVMDLNLVNVNVHLRNVTVDTLELWMWGGHLVMDDTSVLSTFQASPFSAVIDGSHISLSDTSYVTFGDGNVSISNSTFRCASEGHLMIAESANRTCDITGSTFEGVNVSVSLVMGTNCSVTRSTFIDASLALWRNDWVGGHYVVNVTGCEFRDGNAMLVVYLEPPGWYGLPDLPPEEYGPWGYIGNNSLSGPGTAIVSHSSHYLALIQNNTREDGSRMLVAYALRLIVTPEGAGDRAYNFRAEIVTGHRNVVDMGALGLKRPTWFDVMVDLSDDPDSVLSPGNGTARILHPSFNPYTFNMWVSGFETFDPMGYRVELTTPIWPDISEEVEGWVDPYTGGA